MINSIIDTLQTLREDIIKPFKTVLLYILNDNTMVHRYLRDKNIMRLHVSR
jgi:hypothetical protein